VGFIWFLLVLLALGPVIWGLIRWAWRDFNGEDVSNFKSARYWVWRILFAVAGIIGIIVLGWWLGLRVNSGWFSSLGYGERFWTVFFVRIKLFWTGTGIFFIAALLNLVLAAALFVRRERKVLKDGARKDAAKEAAWGTAVFGIGISFVVALMFGAWVSSNWQIVMMYTHQTPTSVAEPIFNKSIGFYFFSLPFWKGFVMPWVAVASIVQFVFVLLANIRMYQEYSDRVGGEDRFKEALIDKVSAHLTTILAVVMAMVCLAIDLSKYSIVFNDGARFFGAGYAEVNYGLPVIKAYTIIFSIVAGLLFIFGWFRHFSWKTLSNSFRKARPFWVIAGIVFVVALIVPLVVKPFGTMNRVNPNEKALQKPYIANAIASTRAAFNLSGIEVTEMSISSDLTEEDIAANALTISNTRLWDWRMLKTWFGQAQGLRRYYIFSDVDIDRYTIAGAERQFMLAARELDTESLLANVPGSPWVNQHFEYTHGLGAVAAAVNEFLPGGDAKLLMQDIPPKVAEGLPIPNPRIYFGETDLKDVFVLPADTKEPTELDYAATVAGSEEIVRNVYDGADGLVLGSCNVFARLPLVNKYGIRAMLWTAKTADEGTRVLMKRNISDRVSALTPFLSFDRDPYIVLRDGLPMVYIWDAYTFSNLYPYSQRISDLDPFAEFKGSLSASGKNLYRHLTKPVNYIRNSVKVVVDAYNGTVDFYIFDENDPIIMTLSAMFPGMFKSWRDMPEDLYAHIRYPEDIFVMQSHVYTTYHIENPDTFYNQEDFWDISREEHGQETGTVEITPYFITLQLPEESGAEYVLMNSFTPLNRASGGQQRINMIAWMAARCDPPNYGKLLVYKFPGGHSVKGTQQMEAEVDQNPEMSAQLTLWNSSGSRVFKGNTLAIPLRRANGEYTIVYVEPVFLQSTNSPKPQIARIIFGTQKGTEWDDTFAAARRKVLNKYYGAAMPAATSGTALVPSQTGTVPVAGGQAAVTGPLDVLIAEADAHFRKYLELTGQGRLDEAGQELQRFFELWTQIRAAEPQR